MLNIINQHKKLLFLTFAFGFAAAAGFMIVSHIVRTNALTTAGFDAADIISDAVMANYSSMSESDIQNFLKSKNSCNDTNLSKANPYIAKGYSYHITNGHFVCMADESFDGESAARIIWQAAQDYQINPQVILVTLQKEQSLVTDTWPNDRQYRKAMGYGCPDTAPCDSQYYGFKNQIRQAASHFHRVLTGEKTSSSYRVGNSYVQYSPGASCGGTVLNIQNRATVALYIYTPYQPGGTGTYWVGDREYSCASYGNRNFYSYFVEWFGNTHAIANIKSIYMPEGTYTLNTTAGKALGFSGTGNGTAAKVVDSNSSDTSQQFTLERDNYQFYKLRNVSSGRYLDVSGAGASDGTQTQLWDSNDTCAQKWAIEIVNDKSYRLRNACSFKSLDINGAAVSSNGAKIQIWTSNNTTAQQWILTNISSAPIDNGTYNIVTTSNKAMALKLENTNNSTRLVTGELHSGITERFQITRGTDGNYKIKNVAANRYLDVAGGNTADGGIVQIYDQNSSCAQRWIIKNSDNNYIITSSCSNKAIDVNAGEIAKNDTNIQTWSSNNTNAQKWKFISPQGRTIGDGAYTIESGVSSDFNLDSDSGTWAKNGTNVQIWTKSGNEAQQFQIKYDDSTGYYSIQNVFSGRNLDVSGASRAPGGNVHNWLANDTCAQKWFIVGSNDNYRILSACSRLALDVDNAAAKNGTNVKVWTVNNNIAQNWKFRNTTIDNSSQLLDGKTYTIQSAIKNNPALDVAGNVKRDGTNVQIYQSNQTDAQKWKLQAYNKEYRIFNIGTNRVLDVSAANTFNGTNVQIWWQIGTTCAQRWQPIYSGHGYYTLKSACSDKVLDVAGANTKNGTNVQIWEDNNTSAQKWKFITND